MNIARSTLAGHHRRVDAALTLDHHSVGGNFLARSHHDHIVDAHHARGNHSLFAVAQHDRLSRTECEQ